MSENNARQFTKEEQIDLLKNELAEANAKIEKLKPIVVRYSELLDDYERVTAELRQANEMTNYLTAELKVTKEQLRYIKAAENHGGLPRG